MKTSPTIFLALILGLGAACAGSRPAAVRTSRDAQPAVVPRTALEVLRLRQPNTEWDAKTVLKGDLVQNGNPDYAATGLRKDRFVVGIVEGPITAHSRTWFLDFPWKGGGEGSLCSEKAKMTVEPLDAAAKAGERKAANKPANKPGVGLNLHDDRCDAFHIYWDPERKTFDWWRL